MGARTGSTAGKLFKIGVDTTTKCFTIDYDTTGSGGAAVSSSYAFDNAWHAVVGLYDGSNIVLYVDGAQVALVTGKTAAAISTTQFAYGKRADMAVEWFKGSISGGFLSPTAWSQPEIIYWSNTGVLPARTISFAHRFQEGTGSTGYDSSGNATNASITSAPYTSDVPTGLHKSVNANLIYNANLEYAPPVLTAATSTSARYIDGTAAGTTANHLFGWKAYGTGTWSAAFDVSTANSGLYSLKLATASTAATVEASQSNTEYSTNWKDPLAIKVQPSTAYTFTHWMQTTYTSGDSNDGAYVDMIEVNGAGTSGTETTTTKVKTTTGWTQYVTTFTTSSATRFVVVQPRIYGNTGTASLIMSAWFDDMVLTPTNPITRALA